MKAFLVQWFANNRVALMSLGRQLLRGIIRLFRAKTVPGFRINDQVVVVLTDDPNEVVKRHRGRIGTVNGAMNGNVGLTLSSGESVSVKPANIRRVIQG